MVNIENITNLPTEERKIASLVLQQLATTGESPLLNSIYEEDYEEIPVSIEKFYSDERYMGKVYQKGSLIYPYWKEFLHNIFHSNDEKKWEIAITGAIGTGKSSVSAIALIYLMYRTLCLKDPQKYYGLTANSQLVFVVLNLTLDLAYSGLFSLIVEAIKLSPWFCERVDIRGKYNYSIEFPKGISFMAGSTVSHTIGKNVIAAILDEMNFSNAPKGSKKSVLELYRNIRRRMESRFLKKGRHPGLLFLVSSKNSEHDFLEQYIQSIKHNNSTIVVDEPVWNVKPPETYKGDRFKVAVGDKTKASRIVSESEDINTLKEFGYKIIEVPEEYRIAFEQDITLALCDVAGISSVSTNKLIPYAGKIEKCIEKSRPSPFMVEQLHMGLDSMDDIKDYLEDLSILKKDVRIPRFAAVDIGLKGDALGLAIVHVEEETFIERFNKSGAVDKLVENIYGVDLLLSIKAIPGSEIPLYKVREFLIWLQSAIGFKLMKTNYDGFQSADSIQLLNVAGIPAGLQSVDRTDTPYLNLRSCILEERLRMYYHPILVKELYDLEHDKKAGKVDHPLVTVDGAPGSKDLSDALCSAVYAAQEYYATQKGSHAIHLVNVKRNLEMIKALNAERHKSFDENAWITDDYQE